MNYLAVLAIVPVYFLCWFINKNDVNKEPKTLLKKIFILGLASVVPGIILELLLENFFPTKEIYSFGQAFVNVFMGIALVEEGVKWIVTMVAGYNSKEFDEFYDAIVYATFASLGFACIENLLYVFGAENAIQTALLRAVLSVPGHACYGVFMGFLIAKAKQSSFNNKKSMSIVFLILSIFVPTVLHTIYDAIAFTPMDSEVIQLVILSSFTAAMIIGSVVIIKKSAKIQEKISNNVPSIDNQNMQQSYVYNQQQINNQQVNYNGQNYSKPQQSYNYNSQTYGYNQQQINNQQVNYNGQNYSQPQQSYNYSGQTYGYNQQQINNQQVNYNGQNYSQPQQLYNYNSQTYGYNQQQINNQQVNYNGQNYSQPQQSYNYNSQTYGYNQQQINNQQVNYNGQTNNQQQNVNQQPTDINQNNNYNN